MQIISSKRDYEHTRRSKGGSRAQALAARDEDRQLEAEQLRARMDHKTGRRTGSQLRRNHRRTDPELRRPKQRLKTAKKRAKRGGLIPGLVPLFCNLLIFSCDCSPEQNHKELQHKAIRDKMRFYSIFTRGLLGRRRTRKATSAGV